MTNPITIRLFLSSNAQDFIEELQQSPNTPPAGRFLSSNAQDFIEEEFDAVRPYDERIDS